MLQAPGAGITTARFAERRRLKIGGENIVKKQVLDRGSVLAERCLAELECTFTCGAYQLWEDPKTLKVLLVQMKDGKEIPILVSAWMSLGTAEEEYAMVPPAFIREMVREVNQSREPSMPERRRTTIDRGEVPASRIPRALRRQWTATETPIYPAPTPPIPYNTVTQGSITSNPTPLIMYYEPPTGASPQPEDPEPPEPSWDEDRDANIR